MRIDMVKVTMFCIVQYSSNMQSKHEHDDVAAWTYGTVEDVDAMQCTLARSGHVMTTPMEDMSHACSPF